LLEQIRFLIKLQVVDKTLFGLMQEQESIPLRLAELSLEEDCLAQTMVTASAELEQVTNRRKALEAESEAVRQHLRKAESKLMGSKTQREYKAATAEIEEARDSLKGSGELVLELMERQEALERQVKVVSEQHDAASAKVAAQREELSQRVQEVDRLVQVLMGERKDLAEVVDFSLLREYDFIRQRKQGVALAPVSNGTCMACHMDIPPQQFNELQRLDKIMACQSCKRLLYWADADPLADLK
jgi:predicted  nucleic acid-binding Zn-ribbon protein